MSRSGQVLTNPVTGERAVVRVGSEDGGDPQQMVVDLYVEPGGAVAGEHVHPELFERFEVLAGTIGLRVDGEERTARPGEAVEVQSGTPHDWWNAGEDVAHVQVDVRGATAARFEDLITTTFGLAHEGKTNAKGMPGLLQLAVIARDYRDVIRFTKPPAAVQAALFGPLAAIGRARGLRSAYPHHSALVITEGPAPEG
jgi:quercetin dioxygenase-like cupin family protein